MPIRPHGLQKAIGSQGCTTELADIENFADLLPTSNMGDRTLLDDYYRAMFGALVACMTSWSPSRRRNIPFLDDKLTPPDEKEAALALLC